MRRAVKILMDRCSFCPKPFCDRFIYQGKYSVEKRILVRCCKKHSWEMDDDLDLFSEKYAIAIHRIFVETHDGVWPL